jgi:hypothetical protein
MQVVTSTNGAAMLADAPLWLTEWARARDTKHRPSQDHQTPSTDRWSFGQKPEYLARLVWPAVCERALAALGEAQWSPADKPRVLSALSVIPATSRDIWLSAGMALHVTGWEDAFEIWDRWSRTCAEKYDEADQHRTWNSFRADRTGGRITLGTIFLLAREHGWCDDQATIDLSNAEGQSGATIEATAQKQTQRDLMMSAAKLRTMRFDAVRYVLPGFIAEGLTLLVGRPKIGKSWWVLDLCLACAGNRSTLGTLMPTHGDVLYLALEDGWRRLQRRLDKLMGAFRGEWPERLALVPMGGWPRADQGGLAKIEEWCKSVQKPVLVVVDTLERIRKPANGKGPLYSADYEAITGLQKIGSEWGIAIVVLHHDRKSDADDAFDTVSGTLGLTGAADTILIIKRRS